MLYTVSQWKMLKYKKMLSTYYSGKALKLENCTFKMK